MHCLYFIIFLRIFQGIDGGSPSSLSQHDVSWELRPPYISRGVDALMGHVIKKTVGPSLLAMLGYWGWDRRQALVVGKYVQLGQRDALESEILS